MARLGSSRASPQQMLSSSSTINTWLIGWFSTRRNQTARASRSATFGGRVDRSRCSAAGRAGRRRSVASGKRTVKQVPPLSLNSQAAAVGLGNLPGDGQPQADPLGLAGAERLEQPVGDVGGRARARCRGWPRSPRRPTMRETMRTCPPGGTASTALSTRFNSRWRSCSSSADRRDRGVGGIDSQLDPAMPAGRPDQLHQLVDQRRQVAVGAAGGLGPAGGEKSLQVLFGQRQLPQGDGQTFLIDVAAMPLMKLHGDPRPGDVVAQMMGQSAAQLTEQRQAFRTFDHPLHFVELAGQGIYRSGQIAQLVVVAAAAEAARNRRGRCGPPAGAARRSAGSSDRRSLRPTAPPAPAPTRRRAAADRPPASGRRANSARDTAGAAPLRPAEPSCGASASAA